MARGEPKWWYSDTPRLPEKLLAPVGAIYGWLAERRIANARPYRARYPILCVGNFTAGGTGKTPFALALADVVAGENRAPWFLTRGYGGNLKRPLLVSSDVHSAAEVGDEPLLLARRAPVVVARDRAAGARMIERIAPDNAVIIMDDGLQNPTLAKDLSIALVDAQRGLGNARVIPAGPLRAPMSVQRTLAQAIVITGRDGGESPSLTRLRATASVPVLRARTVAAPAASLKGRRVVAFAGIANPDRFYSMLTELGAVLVERHAFADHHTFDQREASDLLAAARRCNGELVTTEKDRVRLARCTGALAELRNASETLPITSQLDERDAQTLRELVRRAIAR